VIIESYAERHYLKNFKKKYKNAWDVTWKAVEEEFKRVDSLLNTSVAEIIISKNNYKIIKTEFRVAGTKESRKSSGNRCIIALDKKTNVVSVLLVYHKNDLGHGGETAKWQKIIKDNYKKYRDLF
jgi:hypothetical protein